MEKDISNNELVALIKKGFDQVATKADFKDVATKEDLKSFATRGDLKDFHEDLSHRMDGLELKLTAYVGSWAKDFEKLHSWVKDIDERLSAVEKGK